MLYAFRLNNNAPGIGPFLGFDDWLVADDRLCTINSGILLISLGHALLRDVHNHYI